MMPAIQHVCKNLQDALEKKAASGEMVELKQLCGEFSMDVIAAAAFGINVDSLHNPDEPFVKHALTFENPSGFAVFIMVVCPCLLKFFFKIGLGTFPKAAQDFFLGITDAAFKERQQDENAYNDFLQLLIEAQKEGESQTQVDEEIDYRDQLTTSDEVRANAMLFLLAGYGTVSTTLSWTLFCLANQEDCLKKAQAEKPVDYDTANDLTYLEMCLNESMRLYPAGFLLQREVREDVELGGVMLQKGMSVSFPIFLIHRDPDIWPDPLKFDPERHTAEARAARHPCAFLPFGIGPRNCIGMRLAQLELRMALASVLQKFTPVPCEKTVYPPTLDKMRMAAVDKLWVKFVARDQQA
ncbi:hypothetical protein BaRGS_00022785 [Batillaria attramentaria]|uniref:Cytochrome P450 n=1 Tax=Batillaria attramentaria TaxID=370345 RepID=A0ABD0KFS1_9CAEN